MESSKQEMELFLPLLGLWSKNFFYYICSKLSKVFKIDFQNRKWNFFSTSRPLIKKLLLQHLLHINQGVQNWFSKQEMELPKQEMKLFFSIPGLWSKTSFSTSSPFSPRNSKLVFKTVNGMIQTGNRINYFNSRPLIK